MRSPVVWLSACSCAVALALTGCGGEEAQREPRPALPSALAERLARDAEEVAARLDAADPCGAASVAVRLRTRAIAAVNGPAVPAALKEELLANAQALHDRAAQACSAAQAPAPTTEAGDGEDADDHDDGDGRGKDGRGRGKGKGKGKGKNGGGGDG